MSLWNPKNPFDAMLIEAFETSQQPTTVMESKAATVKLSRPRKKRNNGPRPPLYSAKNLMEHPELIAKRRAKRIWLPRYVRRDIRVRRLFG